MGVFMIKLKCFFLFAGVLLASACATDSGPITGQDGVTLPSVPTLPDSPLSGEVVSDIELPEAVSLESMAPDADADGIADRVDRCAGSTAGSLVDSTGCEIVTGAVEGLKFAPNETTLSVDSRVVLSKLVDVFARYPDVMFSVEGHTDNRGSAAANLELSKQRVLAVVRYMVSNGIDPARLKPFGYGESRPRAANATEEGREQNRRIEINVIDSLL